MRVHKTITKGKIAPIFFKIKFSYLILLSVESVLTSSVHREVVIRNVFLTIFCSLFSFLGKTVLLKMK